MGLTLGHGDGNQGPGGTAQQASQGPAQPCSPKSSSCASGERRLDRQEGRWKPSLGATAMALREDGSWEGRGQPLSHLQEQGQRGQLLVCQIPQPGPGPPRPVSSSEASTAPGEEEGLVPNLGQHLRLPPNSTGPPGPLGPSLPPRPPPQRLRDSKCRVHVAGTTCPPPLHAQHRRGPHRDSQACGPQGRATGAQRDFPGVHCAQTGHHQTLTPFSGPRRADHTLWEAVPTPGDSIPA